MIDLRFLLFLFLMLPNLSVSVQPLLQNGFENDFQNERQELLNYTKENIILQAGQAMLTQANTSSQHVLSMLQ